MNYNSKIFETEHLILKVIDETYAEKVLEYYLRNKEFLKRWEPIRNEDFYDINYHYNQIKTEMAKIKCGETFRVWIFKKGDKDFSKTIGTVGFNNIVRGCFQSCHLGYKLEKDSINLGYITEALTTLIDFVFTELRLHRIEANIIPENAPSLRVVEKLGFCNEGLAKKYLKINGKWEDHIHMVLLNNELE